MKTQTKLDLNTIYLGDCLEVMAELPDHSVDMILTDPPYGTTECKWDTVIDLSLMWEQLKRIVKPNGAIVMTANQPFTTTLISSNLKMFKYSWVYKKRRSTGFLLSKIQPLRIYEDVVVFYSKQPTYNPQMRTGFPPYKKTGLNRKFSDCYGGRAGDPHVEESDGSRFPINVIEFGKDKSRVHPTQKPVALMEYLIKTYTNEGETVLDFTIGSGTTAIAAIRSNRNYIGIEKDPAYHAIALKRIEEESHE